jgi:protein phosphatase
MLLREALEAAHTTIYQVAQSQPQCAGMGTTAIACLLHDDRMSIAYVGDSRLYRLRQEQLEQITRDHSLIEELVARGHYTREEAGQLVRRNIVTRALGVEPAVEVDLIEEGLDVGDIVLLCSDGLTDMLDDEAIRATLVEYANNLGGAVEALIGRANERGGKDNVSVVLARVDAPFPLKRPWWERLTEWF